MAEIKHLELDYRKAAFSFCLLFQGHVLKYKATEGEELKNI